jgi:hypothetical protein
MKDTSELNYEEYGIVGFETAYFGNSPAFRRRMSPPSSVSKTKPSKKRASGMKAEVLSDLAGFVLVLIFNPEDGGDMLPRNVGLFTNCSQKTVLYTVAILRRSNPSLIIFTNKE